MDVEEAEWVLDGGPFDTLACVLEGQMSDDWPSDTFFVAEETDESTDSGTYRNQLLKTDVWTVFEIDMMDDLAGEILYEHFRDSNTRTNQNLGEHQALARILADNRTEMCV